MKHGSLFSGIGGFDLAAEWMGWENVFHCEWDKFCQHILKYYWPNAYQYGNIDEADFTIWRGSIDVLSGGFPCQPFSTAGKRKGKEDERHKWPQMLRAIREIQPRWVVGENVRGFVNWNGGMVFDEVQADLETSGYEVQPFILPACGVNAPHKRERVWIVAYRANARIEAVHKSQNGADESFTSSNPNSSPAENTIQAGRQIIDSGIDSDTDSIRQQGQRRPNYPSRVEAFREWKASWSYNDGRWPTQPPVCSGDDGIPAGLARSPFIEWEQSIGKLTPAKHRLESLKGYGNAIVPQVALQIFKAIEQYEQLQSINP